MWEKVTENLRDIARIYVISKNSVHCSVCCWARGNVSQNAGWVEKDTSRRVSVFLCESPGFCALRSVLLGTGER